MCSSNESQIISKEICLVPKQVNNSTQEMLGTIQSYRGRELPGFCNYKMFEVLLQEHVAKLKEPAIVLLNSIKGTITRLNSTQLYL